MALSVGAALLPDGLPNTYVALVTGLTLLPLLAVILVGTSKGLYVMKFHPGAVSIDLNDFRKGAAPNLAAVCCLPISALSFLAVSRTGYIFNFWSTFQVMLAGGIAAALTVQWVQSWFWVSLPTLIIVWAAIWGGSTAVLGNCILDGTAPKIIRVRVTAKHITAGKRPSYNLTLAPWGPKFEADDLSVTGDLYFSVLAGEEICVYLHPGAFGARWWEASLCQ